MLLYPKKRKRKSWTLKKAHNKLFWRDKVFLIPLKCVKFLCYTQFSCKVIHSYWFFIILYHSIRRSKHDSSSKKVVHFGHHTLFFINTQCFSTYSILP